MGGGFIKDCLIVGLCQNDVGGIYTFLILFYSVIGCLY